MKKILFILFLIATAINSNAQDYMRAFGIRTGINSGFTYKAFINEEKAYEGILSLKQGITATVLKETHVLAFLDLSDRLFYYYGFGGHFGFTNQFDESNTTNISGEFRRTVTQPVLGLDVMIGTEYRFTSVPLVAGIEIKPFFDLFGSNYFSMHSGDLSLSIKYIFD